jgi:hypothetical protein
MTCLATRVNCVVLRKERESSAWSTRYVLMISLCDVELTYANRHICLCYPSTRKLIDTAKDSRITHPLH